MGVGGKQARLFEVARASWAKPRPFNGHGFHRIPAPSKLYQQLPLAASGCHHPAMLPTSSVYTDDTLVKSVRIGLEIDKGLCQFGLPNGVKSRMRRSPRVSHFLKVEPKISISEDKSTNRGHPNAQILLANTGISASPSSSQAVSQMCEEENK
jgi:hypothetical protein